MTLWPAAGRRQGDTRFFPLACPRVMRIEMEEKARGVAPEAALAWWTDFRDGPTDHGFVPGSHRRVVHRDGSDVTMEDAFGVGPVKVFSERTRARREGDSVRFSGTNTFGTFEGSYTFRPASAGTEIRLMAHVRLRKGLRWSEPVARQVAVRVLRQDLRAHVEELEKDLAEARK